MRFSMLPKTPLHKKFDEVILKPDREKKREKDSGCRSAAWAGGGGRCRCPAGWTRAPRGPFCPRAPLGQLSASRKGHGAGVRGVTPSPCFPRARRCGPHGRTQTCPVFPASPMDPDSPDSQTCVLSPETAGPGVQNRRHRKGPRAARPPPQRAPGSASLPPWGKVVPLPSRR